MRYPAPTVSLSYSNLLLKWHNIFIRDLPWINPVLSRAQGELIMSNIGDLVLGHHEYRRNKALLHHATTAKGPANLLIPNVHHLLRHAHVTNFSSLPPLCTVLARLPKAQQLSMI